MIIVLPNSPVTRIPSMFRTSHFSELASHRGPVLQLYKRIIRHAGHLPTGLANDVFNNARSAFRSGKRIKSPSLAKRKIELAYEGERELAQYFISKDKDAAYMRLKKFVRPEKGLSTIKRMPIDFDRNSVEVFKNQQLSKEYNKPLARDSEAYKMFVMDSRTDTFRKRALRWMKIRGIITTKEHIDPQYIDIFVVPQLRELRYQKQAELRKQRETTYRPVRVSSLLTPDGPFTILTVPGQGRRTSLQRAMRIHNALHEDITKKLVKVDEMIDLARYEATWEATVEERSSSSSRSKIVSITNSWTKHLIQYKQALVQKRARNYETNRHYRKILITKKKYLDNVLQGVVSNNRDKWSSQYYQRPILHDLRIYRGLYRYVHKQH